MTGQAASGAAAGGTAVPRPAEAAAPADAGEQPRQPRTRDYPEEPRVGVGVVILRALPPARDPEVLLIRRAKEPSKGLWCFPGGSLELGETLVDCAVRETQEETGLQLRNAPQQGELFSDGLDFPSPVSCSDAIMRDPSGRLLFHYAIVNLAAVPEDPHQPPVPADDVDAAQWFPVSQLRGLQDLVTHCDRVAERAVQQFSVSH